MSLVRVKRSIDALAAALLAPLAKRPPAPGWRLIGWDGEQGVQLTIGRGDELVLIELEPRDEARGCYGRTGRFNVCARRAFSSEDLGPSARRAVEAVIAVVAEREKALPDVGRSESARSSLVREVEVPRLLMSEGAGHYYINPYVGCTIGCEFCYVAPRADLSRRLEGLPGLAWGRYVDVKINAAEVLRGEVRKKKPGAVRLSPILTDPYQPLERRYRITRQCLEVLLEAGFKPVILTRGALVAEDLGLLKRFPAAAVGMSVPTDDDRVRRLFEPGADPIEARLDVLARAREAGLRTFAVVQPALPMNPRRLAGLLSPLIDAVRVDRMHDLPRARRLYEAAGRPEAAGDEFFDRTLGELRSAFAAQGVPYDEMDDLAGLLGEKRG